MKLQINAPIAITAQKVKFSIKDFFSKYEQIRRKQFSADLVTFTEEILNGKRHFLCSVFYAYSDWSVEVFSIIRQARESL